MGVAVNLEPQSPGLGWGEPQRRGYTQSPLAFHQPQQLKTAMDQVRASQALGTPRDGDWALICSLSPLGFGGGVKPQKPGESCSGLLCIHEPPEARASPYTLTTLWIWEWLGAGLPRGLGERGGQGAEFQVLGDGEMNCDWERHETSEAP